MEYSQSRAVVKLLFVLGLIGVLISFVLLIGKKVLSSSSVEPPPGVIIKVPFKKSTFQDLGVVFEPEISMLIETSEGEVKKPFLLDSGAVVSSLPREMAEVLGYDLAFLRRSAFRGFGKTTSFVYHGEMKVTLGDEKVVLPAVFTEAQGTRYILGRKGFFDQYSILFDHQNSQIEIRR